MKPFCSSLSDSALPTIAALEPIDQIDDVEEPAACAAADATASDRDGKMGLTATGSAGRHDVALLSDEAAGGKVTDERLVDRGALELEVSVRSLASGSLAIVSWYLIERAAFATSALSKSPMMR
jgi:hypothetical protein